MKKQIKHYAGGRESKFISGLLKPFRDATAKVHQMNQQLPLKDVLYDYSPKSLHRLPYYLAIDPRGDFPNLLEGVGMMGRVLNKSFKNSITRDYELGPELSDSVSDAAWRKRLGLKYDNKFLPVWNGDTVSLPKQLESEIPTDTTFLKNRIARTEELMNYSKMYHQNRYMQEARDRDKQALEALRKTYKTGLPVGMPEMSFNSRQWVNNGIITPTMSPLNVLGNYNIRYDKDTNRMYYSDQYDFNKYDSFVPGEPFRIRGAIDLNTPKL